MLLTTLKNIYSAYFKSKDRIAIDGLNKLTKKIYSESHPVNICFNFCEFTLENECYLKHGLIMEEESPSSKNEVMLSAIYCLQLIRNPIDMKENPENLEKDTFELVKIIASRSYELSAVIVSREELAEILLKPMNEVQSIYSKKKKMHQDKWEDYVSSNLDTEALAYGMLK
ncbi:MAG: hypothetical protein B7Y05_08200 [Polynucleobacter sp. 24-46-87]|jgi:hypothetical protein|nr:MAG: hypothetical protein B7Y05_08200 [Polynucleobacter sp. 24-46-87]OZA41548.1 MAG: hypothetical protein B7X83_02050 [Polynucleobacter sp. 17-46-58]HQT20999.1 hypothetical protein [Polynucleobacter sp.]HQT41482.1 hypothetical protein [Polynucleobacter sp.]